MALLFFGAPVSRGETERHLLQSGPRTDRLPSYGMEASCVICRGAGPLDVIAELATSWVTAPPRAPLPGYLCVVAKRHVAEPFELGDAESTAFWLESMAVAAVLSELVEPSKMNYEIHGNTIPHLHLHLFPRFAGDPFEGRPVDGRSTSFQRPPEEIARLTAAMARIA
jgi:diadenosine tetraphosphate (Ap4A) HIT family hydrolase